MPIEREQREPEGILAGHRINESRRFITADTLFLGLAVIVWMVLEARQLRIAGAWVYVVQPDALAGLVAVQQRLGEQTVAQTAAAIAFVHAKPGEHGDGQQVLGQLARDVGRQLVQAHLVLGLF